MVIQLSSQLSLSKHLSMESWQFATVETIGAFTQLVRKVNKLKFAFPPKTGAKKSHLLRASWWLKDMRGNCTEIWSKPKAQLSPLAFTSDPWPSRGKLYETWFRQSHTCWSLNGLAMPYTTHPVLEQNKMSPGESKQSLLFLNTKKVKWLKEYILWVD